MALQITKTDGRLVGQIDYSRGIKHRITLPKEMSVQHKLLIIFYAVNLVSGVILNICFIFAMRYILDTQMSKGFHESTLLSYSACNICRKIKLIHNR